MVEVELLEKSVTKEMFQNRIHRVAQEMYSFCTRAKKKEIQGSRGVGANPFPVNTHDIDPCSGPVSVHDADLDPDLDPNPDHLTLT